MKITDDLRTHIIAGAAGIVIGLALGWKLYRPGPVKPEPAASAVRQADGSLIVERAAPGTDPGPTPHLIPPGGKVERRISVTVQPRPASGPLSPVGSPPTTSETPPTHSGTACPPVRVDLSLVRMPDATRRVVASSPDGEVTGGLDIPMEPRPPEPRPIRWAAGGLYDPANRTYGAFVHRDFGPFRVGIEATQEHTGASARVLVGVRW